MQLLDFLGARLTLAFPVITILIMRSFGIVYLALEVGNPLHQLLDQALIIGLSSRDHPMIR